jgi:hypothetical protein
MAMDSRRESVKHRNIAADLPQLRPRLTRSALLFAALFAALPAAILLTAASPLWAVSCVTQTSLQPADREALLTAGSSIADSITAQNFDQLQSSLLPAVIGDWEGIRGLAQGAGPVLKGGKIYWGNGYLLDAMDLKASADTDFFCTSQDSAATITISLRNLPAGRYALLLGDSEGAPLAGQLALILGADSTAGGKWKLGGLFVREGALEGPAGVQDGIWFWRHARDLTAKNAASNRWAAWFSYDTARWLLVPVDFLSSPHLEKLNREQSQLGASPADSMPLTVTGTAAVDAGKIWRITALRLDSTLHAADLGLTYEGTGLTDPQAARAEAVAVMSGLLKLHPDLRENFHGLWAYAEKDGKRSFAIELAMHDIP